MSKEKEFDNWQDVIVDFFEGKKEAEQEKYLKDTINKISKSYEDCDYFDDNNLRDFFDAKKNKKSKTQSSLNFQQQKLKQIFDNLDSYRIEKLNLNADEIKESYNKEQDNICEKYNPNAWLTKNSENAKSVSFATHVVKLTHSKIDTPSFYDGITDKKNDQLTTSSLKNKIVDGAVAGNQFAPIFQFLELELDGKKLASEFMDINNTVLQDFSESEEKLKEWSRNFNKSLATCQISAHPLLKQIYFPIGGKSYHLLCNVKSSSIAQTIFENMFKNNEESAKKLRKKDKYSNVSVSWFTQKSKISVTASNHSNASQLNGKRGGKINLFSTQSPTWQSKLKPPINKESMFDTYHYSSNTNDDIKYLVEFLLRYENIDLSIRDPERQKWLEKWATSIVDDFLFFVGNINNLASGWSAEKGVKLKIEHQYLLDPCRKDKEFQANRKDSDWQAVVVNDFSIWLNKQLKNKNEKFTPQEEYSRTWKKIMEQELREYNQIIEVSV